MNPSFSVKYNEEVFCLECNKVYEFEPGVTITPVIKEYKEYEETRADIKRGIKVVEETEVETNIEVFSVENIEEMPVTFPP